MKKVRHLLLACLGACLSVVLEASGQQLDGYNDIAAVKERLLTLALQDVEGLWRFPDSGTLIAIERDDDVASRFRIVAIESPYVVIEPGELLGYARPTTKRNVFDARLKETHAGNSTDAKMHDFLLTINESDAIALTPVKKGIKIGWDWWRLFPYMFRLRVNKVDNTPKDLHGVLRVWPRSVTVPPRQPRYL